MTNGGNFYGIKVYNSCAVLMNYVFNGKIHLVLQALLFGTTRYRFTMPSTDIPHVSCTSHLV